MPSPRGVAFDWQGHAKRLARNAATAEVFLPGGAACRRLARAMPSRRSRPRCG